jgi:hypothetical protein
MNTSIRSKWISDELWSATYNSVPKDTGQKPEDDALFRFRLSRNWESQNEHVVFIGVNPSKATHLVNDPTVARCMEFAKAWGYGSMAMMNLFPYRATDPAAMKRFYKREGPKIKDFGHLYDDSERINESHLKVECAAASMIICAWGNDGKFLSKGEWIYRLLAPECASKLHHFGETKEGEPRHPLYLLSNSSPILYTRDLSR